MKFNLKNILDIFNRNKHSNNERNEIITYLKKHSPLIYNLTATQDMGYEFSAISEKGIEKAS